MNSQNMNLRSITSIIFLCAHVVCGNLVLYAQQGDKPSRPIDLKCEHMFSPLGIDTPSPRLTWRLDGGTAGAKQIAYQILVGLDSMEVVADKGNIWDTGKVEREERLVSYNGLALTPWTRYFWKVVVWDGNNRVSDSDVSAFETGMMGTGSWKGSWISDQHDIHYQPAPYFRKEFQAKKNIKNARAYIAVAGLYELSLNGQRVGNHRLDPMYTRFDRRTLYVAHDVTALLTNGANAIGVVLGNGWY